LLLALGIGSRAIWYSATLGIFLLAHGSLAELLMSEPLAVFLVAAFSRHGFEFLENGGQGKALASGFCLGALALTKGFYGYAIAACLILGTGAWLISRSKTSLRALALCGIALAAASPYLAYTWKLTGRFFYWGNSGGALLYCLAMPESRFLGDWFNSDAIKENPDFFGPHSFFYRRVDSLGFVARDAALKSEALRNAREHPGKVFRNWRANVNRIVFGYPVSAHPGADPDLATGNRAFVYALPFLLVLFSIPAGMMAWRNVPPGLWAMLVFFSVSFAGLSLLSAVPRQVFPLLPLLWTWVVFAGEKLLIFRVKVETESGEPSARVA
jgi:hypothetical protein